MDLDFHNNALHRSFDPARKLVGLVLGCLAAMSWIGAGQCIRGQEVSVAGTGASAGIGATKVIDFARDIAPLLHNRCASCHEGLAAKNGFEVVDREAVLGYIELGSSADSSLWTDYLIAPKPTLNESSLLMPPDGPLPAHELALLRVWMDEGADWPEGAVVGVRVPVEAAAIASLPAGQRWFRAIGFLHPAIVHFPISLLSLAAVSVLLSYGLGDRYAQFAYTCVVLGFFFSIATAVLGWSFAESRGYADWATMLPADASEERRTIFLHRWLGSAVAIVGLVVVVAGWRARTDDGSRPGHVWRIGTLLLALLVAMVGHQGGELVYGDLLGKALEQLSK